jgi:pimeloyl-ACP methyl ester carboxylesterase
MEDGLMMTRKRWAGVVLSLLVGVGLTVGPSSASSSPLPGFRDGYVQHDGLRIHYVTGGHGPALVLLHGWPSTWYSWEKIAPDLARNYTVIAPDLRGLGESEVPETDDGEFTTPVLAADVHAVVTHLGFRTANVVGHDWGGGVALAYAATYRSEVRRLVVMEAPPTGDFEEYMRARPDLFWFGWFQMVDTLPEQLIAGRESVYYPWLYRNSVAVNGAIGPDAVARYVAAYSRPGSSRAGFELYRQMRQSTVAVDALIARDGKLTMPMLGVGGQYSMAGLIAAKLPRLATDVTPAVVPNAAHWVTEENPTYVRRLLLDFLS